MPVVLPSYKAAPKPVRISIDRSPREPVRDTLMTDTSVLATRFEKGEKISFPFQFPDDDTVNTVMSFMAKIFTRSDRMFLFETVSSLLMELIQNAVKANAKRVFFTSRGLDINNPEEYNRGMADFKTAAINLDTISSDLRNSGYHVEVTFTPGADDETIISISNNARIIDSELERLNMRIESAWECATFGDLHEKAYDTTEGAGLGIVLTIFLLKNIGVDRNKFILEVGDSSVKVTLSLPKIIRSDEISSSIKTRIIDEVNNLPTFPGNILEFYDLCNDPDTPINALAEKIERDPSITADVLRLANSAGFVSGKRIKGIHDAIIVIGIQNFKLLLTVTASRKILDGRYRHFQEIWEHCNRVTFYTQRIASKISPQRKVYNTAISALLHDIGKIVLLSIDLPLLDQISSLVKNNRIRTSTIVEELSIGVSHATVGGLIAQRWQFPDELVEAIKFHHSPTRAKEEYRDTVMAVYLADILCNIERKRFSYLYIETDVLERFGLTEKNAVAEMHATIREEYEAYLSGPQE